MRVTALGIRIMLMATSQSPASVTRVKPERNLCTWAMNESGARRALATLRLHWYTAAPTGASEYAIPGATTAGDIPVRELAYTTVEAELANQIKGVHDLYVVFGSKDVRVKDLQTLGAPSPTLSTPTITGSPAVGQQLTAKVDSVSRGAELSYQWLVDGAPIRGADRAKYKVGPKDKGKTIAVTATATSRDGGSTSATSEGVHIQ
ncbi:hypothetical protein ACEYYH_17545 [Microbacterium trichothecenolyticum]|uniref:hypothetical protein n=1 Tax=Microbacterium trichothecenolyticum TaxID=69370 RepID=UPI0035BE3253